MGDIEVPLHVPFLLSNASRLRLIARDGLRNEARAIIVQLARVRSGLKRLHLRPIIIMLGDDTQFDDAQRDQ